MCDRWGGDAFGGCQMVKGEVKWVSVGCHMGVRWVSDGVRCVFDGCQRGVRCVYDGFIWV